MSTTLTPTKNNRRAARGAELTDEQNAESGFTASAQLADNLQRVLVDLIELSLQGKQAHWNVVGTNFRDTHLQLDEIIDAAREFSDTVAERLRALHALPDGRSDTVAETTTLPEFPQGEVSTSEVVDLITERIDAVTATVRGVHDDVDGEDPTSADILHAILERLEQLAWLVSSENRVPRR
ncbi:MULTISPECIES: Dps family protein [Microbacterium]|jgi:starvation-inducible DNA-binding protein|uniref:Dps family protein n=1 Tax=Microbacterium TaxID=33882 RepID=UPI0006FD244A|nr:MULTISPECIES: DNA starvation/stationary phase protection protein [unclassified Microbacterium]MBN9197485.1 DNA starvation/stationary phase protection protein [Microbacterium ginsengisoli]MCK9914212.1 DNA starvation/stationary phase protection protein [Microbacteriaceae bacterium K1510]KQR93159.1 DNA starvation/stationary phase protection protein [Microbacterium sp. Leaf351]KQS05446.1 DNA starvation/stationary phase protection protein [Microbacterium sp. Leaf347]ODU76365.1 MAG: DNA starvatio